uniref:MazG domain-containing protein n=1 Tax=Parastrongyloides trichosuri TaxID=131310 RepID=A0A0N5A693_PARTI
MAFDEKLQVLKQRLLAIMEKIDDIEKSVEEVEKTVADISELMELIHNRRDGELPHDILFTNRQIDDFFKYVTSGFCDIYTKKVTGDGTLENVIKHLRRSK